jgi:hypothetical protein
MARSRTHRHHLGPLSPCHLNHERDTVTQEMAEDAGAAARIAASFAQQGLMVHLGARLGQVGHGEVHIHLPRRGPGTWEGLAGTGSITP